MAGLTAHGGTFTFQGFTAAITGLSVETPTAEVVDMTPSSASASTVVMVPTGAWSGGSISVDYIRLSSTGDPQGIVKLAGQLTFSSAGYSVSRRCILQSASTEARFGDLVRGSLRFVLTDYQGT